LYTAAAELIKFSVLLVYRRLFGSTRRFRILLSSIGIFTACYSIAQAFLAIFQCTPMKKMWDMTVPGTCVKMPQAAQIPSALNSATDVVMVLMPLPLIWGLHVQKKWKVQLLGIFMLGGL